MCFEERSCRGRSVSSLEWNPKYTELFASAYRSGISGSGGISGYYSTPSTSNTSNSTSQSPLVHVWNAYVPTRPELTFTCGSDVLSLAFDARAPQTLVGGTFSGQLVRWDTRVRGSAPVLKSPPGSGHAHPVFSLSALDHDCK